MSTLEMVTLIAVATWLGLLTLVIVLTIRQVSLITAQLDRPVTPQYIDDGPALHSRLPKEVIASLPQLESGVTNVLLLSATCKPCRQLAEGLQHKVLPNGGAVALVPGRKELADGIAELLPESTQVIRDPTATEIAQLLDLEFVPAAIVIERGEVIAKAPREAMSSADELMGFLDQGANTPNVPSLIPA